MGIKVTKPEVNIREKLNELTQEQGIKGTEILRADDAQTVRNAIGAGRKNLLINGGFDVWQRGTSFSNHTSYSSDRWTTFSGNTGSIIKLVNVQLPNNHKVNAFRWEATGTASTWIDTYQLIDDFQKLSHKTFTMSAWVRTNMNNVFFRQGSTANFGEEISRDGSWHFVSRTFTLGNIVSSTIGQNGSGFGIVKASSQYSVGHYLEFANVQLEVGSVATDFEYRSYGEELALCQRYYTYSPYISEGCIINTVFGAVKNNSQYTWCTVEFPVEMRTTPTFTTISGAGGDGGVTADGKVRFVGTGDSSSGSDAIPYSAGANSNKTAVVKTYNEHNSSGWYGIQAGYTADAEL